MKINSNKRKKGNEEYCNSLPLYHENSKKQKAFQTRHRKNRQTTRSEGRQPVKNKKKREIWGMHLICDVIQSKDAACLETSRSCIAVCELLAVLERGVSRCLHIAERRICRGRAKRKPSNRIERTPLRQLKVSQLYLGALFCVD